MRKSLVLALVLMAALFSMPASRAAFNGEHGDVRGVLVIAQAADASESIEVGGVERTYVIHVPSMRPSRMPLLLMFHGGGGTGRGMVHFTGLDELANRYGLLVVYPDGLQHQWNDGGQPNNGANDVGFVSALIDKLSRDFSIDPKRIFTAGISNGAMFSQRLGCQLANRIAGFASIAGNMPTDTAPSCKPSRAISVLQISGTSDPLMPFEGGTVHAGRHVTVESADQTVTFWAKHDDCVSSPTTTTLPTVEPADGTSVVRERYTGCHAGSAVTYYIVRGGGHTWPGGFQYLPQFIIGKTSNQLDASQTIVDFFLKR